MLTFIFLFDIFYGIYFLFPISRMVSILYRDSHDEIMYIFGTCSTFMICFKSMGTLFCSEVSNGILCLDLCEVFFLHNR